MNDVKPKPRHILPPGWTWEDVSNYRNIMDQLDKILAEQRRLRLEREKNQRLPGDS